MLDEQYFTTLAFVDVNEERVRTFSFARKPSADTKEEIDVDVLDARVYFYNDSCVYKIFCCLVMCMQKKL